ncbi:hypothetical protein BN890_12010 [Bacteroides xylanisolvens SD CC 1b]|uniref:Uncharacterized protein n=1 Tax=Bacteroides xylanisolvens SD CC 1b TaxID=702447 RepID=W6P1R5_9BACE|nr:hypothetical protein BN891_8630 [Bacteroides xylanisolvens SD CC 2a]CDM03634.1 hypothetical protein BN890_12010 [Bacteroides xylanisolvens SD CC 1b]
MSFLYSSFLYESFLFLMKVIFLGFVLLYDTYRHWMDVVN